METEENDFGGRGDRSPEPTPEQLLEHQRLAEKVNYRIALNELSFYKQRSMLQEPMHAKVRQDRAWTDHQGRVWVSEKPISPPARHELAMIVEVIRDFEARYPENQADEHAVNDIAEIRSARSEPSNDRLACFERQAAARDPFQAAPDISPDPTINHEAGIER